MTAGPTPPRDADRRLDGLACAICGLETGPMVPVGDGPRGQLFAHPECAENAEDTAREGTPAR